MCLAFALLDQQCVSSQGVLQVKLCPCNSKAIGKVSDRRFSDYGFRDIDWPENGSLDDKYSKKASFATMQVNPTYCATAP